MKNTSLNLLSAILLLAISTAGTAQTSSSAYASANIVIPVAMLIETGDGFTDIYSENIMGQSGNPRLTIAKIKLDVAANDLFSISIPDELELLNIHSKSTTTAHIVAKEAIATQVPGGQKMITIDSELALENTNALGKHNTAPYEITINFN